MRGLPHSLYLDPARSTQEADSIFAPAWQYVCHASDLPAPGTAARFDGAGRSVVVLRTRAGDLRAYRNACRHRGARLVEGDAHTGLAFCVDGRLRCPYHGWTYDETGALVSVPQGQSYDADFDPAQHALLPAHVEQWRGFVFVALERPAAALASMLDAVGADWPDCASMRRQIEPRTVTCAADWKLGVEHLLDTAHLPVARPGFRWHVYGTPRLRVAHASALQGVAGLPDERPDDAWSVRATRALLRRVSPAAEARSAFLWPNTLLQLATEGVTVLQVLPTATGHCTFRESRYALPDASRDMQLLRYLQRRVRRQALQADARLLARVQQGLASGADAGPIATNEPGLRWFVTHYSDRALTPRTPARAPGAARRKPRKRAAPVGA